MKKRANKITVVGGGGHIGLPLAIVFANKGFDVLAYDKNINPLNAAKKGKMPFMEKNGNIELKKALKKKLNFSNKIEKFIGQSTIIITVGTPVDEFINPDLSQIKNCIDELLPIIKKGQLIILRSTVSPGTTEWLANYLQKKQKKCDIAFCHERVVQGNTFLEIEKLPQIIAGSSPKATQRASKIFKKISKKIITCKLQEAEFSKLYSNAFRYIQFAIANEFYMLADNIGLDFKKIRKITTDGYPRADALPSAGFAAGPCLYKDTMQLVSFSHNNFHLGYNSMLINEGLVLYIANKIGKKFNLKNKVIGLLGMSFKAECDDIRSSLSYKLKNKLNPICKNVICSDPYVKNDSSLQSLKSVLKKSDIIIKCIPHKIYKNLNIKKKYFLDIWS
tara:strand:- start:12544 stop:13716 length:1173 start_codon:yes stop_codon:yes gene_type:complete